MKTTATRIIALNVHDSHTSGGRCPVDDGYTDWAAQDARVVEWTRGLPVWPLLLAELGLGGRTLATSYRHEYDEPGEADTFGVSAVVGVEKELAVLEERYAPEHLADKFFARELDAIQRLRAALDAGLTVAIWVSKTEDPIEVNQAEAIVFVSADGRRGAVSVPFSTRR